MEKQHDYQRLLNKYSIYLILAVMIVIAILTSEEFRTFDNIMNLLARMSIVGILAIGQTIILITGNFDLSHGSYIALSSVLIAIIIPLGNFATIGITFIIFIFLGMFNAFFVNRGVASMIVTLGMTGIARSAALFLSNSDAVNLPDGNFGMLAYGTITNIPYCVILWLFLILLFSFLLKYTRIGKNLYAVGGNKESARLSGVNVNRTIYVAFVISAICSLIAGAIYTSRLGVALPDKAVGYERDSIAAAVIGGTSMKGGVGNLGETLVGVLIYGIITNFFNLIGINAYWQQVFKGLVIAIAVYVNIQKTISTDKRKVG